MPAVRRGPQRGVRSRRRSVQIGLEALEERWLPSATIIVTTAADDPTTPIAGQTTLRDAINQANANPGSTIQFADDLTNQTITLDGSALPDITQNVTITGLGANNLAISGNNQSRVFTVDGGTQVSIADLTIEDGNADYGGGIYNAGSTLTVSNCTLSDNSASDNGGAIAGSSTTVSNSCLTNNSAGENGGAIAGSYITVSNSCLTNNSAGENGGGIYGTGGTINNCTISDNSAAGEGPSDGGGGIYDNQFEMTVSNSTITGNSASQFGGGIFNYDGNGLTVSACKIEDNSAASAGDNEGGGGIFNDGHLTVSDSTLSGNKATTGHGGGIWNGSVLTVSNTTFADNSASGAGGGIYNGASIVTMSDCTFTENSATGGGGIYNGGTMTASNCTLENNSAIEGTYGGNGGGIYNAASNRWTVTVNNCTIADNTASQFGGGIDNLTTMTVSNSTIASNSAAVDGGGIYSGQGDSVLNNTIVADSTSGGDLYGSFSGAYDLIGDGSGGLDPANNLLGSPSNLLDPLLAPLGNYGGPTQTMALLPGSPAIDAGSNALIAIDPSTGLPFTTDQRGQPRIVNGTVDIGAFESQGFTLTPTSGTNQSTLVDTIFSDPLSVAVIANNPLEPVNGGVVTFLPPGTGASATLLPSSAVISGGSASVTATANGTVGSYNVASAASGVSTPASFSLTNVAATTTTVLQSSANPSILGQSITLTATVSSTSPGPPVPTGSVDFFDTTTNTDLGSATLADGVATLTTPALGVGSHVIEATYGGNGTFLGASAKLTQSVNKDGTTTSLISSAKPTIPGQAVTLTATVAANAPGSGTPTGSVDFFDTTTNTDLGSATLTGGVATLPTSALPLGSHVITATYSGDDNFLTSNASLTQVVTNGILAQFDQSHAKHAGSTIPIQIELVTANGQDISSVGTTVTAVGLAATTDTTDTVGSIDPSLVGALQPVQAAGNSNPDNVFRVQGGSQPFYMYNLKTPTGLTAGTYRLYFSVGNDPLLHWVTFSVD